MLLIHPRSLFCRHVFDSSFVYTWHRLDHPASIPTPMIPTTGFTLCFFKTAIYHLYRKPENSGENSNGTVYIGGNFPEKKVIYRPRYYLFPVLTETTKIFCTIRLDYQCACQASCYFVNGTTQSRSCFRCPKKHQYHLPEIFHRNCRTNGKRSWFLSFPKVIRPTALVHCLMTRSSDWDEVFKGMGRSLFFLLFENDSRAL